VTRDEREEKDRRLAEWLGWSHFKQECGFECLYWIGLPPGEKARCPVPDFYTDEAANALLLDRLLSEGCPPDDLPTNFKWAWQWVGQLIMREIQFHQNNDRKTAICEAVLKLMEAQ
jgi:hypothetical protein